MRYKMPLCAALFSIAFFSSSLPVHATPMAFGGGCLLTVTATFSPGVKATPTTSTMSWDGTSSLCAGTAMFTLVSTLHGDASPAGTVTCNSIAVSGGGRMSYDGAGSQDFNWTFVGGTGAGTIVLQPTEDAVVGTIEVVSTTGLVNCEWPTVTSGPNVTFNGQTTVTYTGVLTWAEATGV